MGLVNLWESLLGTPDPGTPNVTTGQHFRRKALTGSIDGSAVTVLTDFLDAAAESDYSFLAVLQSDMDRGGLPDILAAVFSDSHWGYELRFFLPEVSKLAPSETVEVTCIALELPDSGFLSRALRYSNGWRWSANLGVCGVQVPEEWIGPSLLALGRHEITSAMRQQVRTAFRLDSNMTELHMYCAAGVLEGTPRLARYLS